MCASTSTTKLLSSEGALKPRRKAVEGEPHEVGTGSVPTSSIGGNQRDHGSYPRITIFNHDSVCDSQTGWQPVYWLGQLAVVSKTVSFVYCIYDGW